MGKQAQTIELSTELGINYIPCCGVVLMHHNTKIRFVRHEMNFIDC